MTTDTTEYDVMLHVVGELVQGDRMISREKCVTYDGFSWRDREDALWH